MAFALSNHCATKKMAGAKPGQKPLVFATVVAETGKRAVFHYPGLDSDHKAKKKAQSILIAPSST
ncbi:hypothetical protein [Aquitalea palustris]|uniref:hypothetical protein n=1 Tax=Aquitalea palustris TaxID=2480983 RepID=UPI0011C408E0|nr:hypothetical protein [Aquitalea palustris]